ncbi:beta-ketoacyl synthase chain length factor [Kaarinaea lacus]
MSLPLHLVNTVHVHAVSIIAPGLSNWSNCREILRGEKDYSHEELPKLAPDLLPKNERRRTTNTIKLALCAGEQATRSPGIDISKISSVFASSNGDLDIIDRICNDLLLPDRPISPTQFHNSVHNAPAGYWAIASHSQRPSNSISAGHYSFAVGLVEAMTIAGIEKETTLLVAYDHPTTEPLTSLAETRIPFACGLLLSTDPDTVPGQNPVASLQLAGYDNNDSKPLENAALEQLCEQSPVAQSLRLLEAIAFASGSEGREVRIPASDSQLLVIKVAS